MLFYLNLKMESGLKINLFIRECMRDIVMAWHCFNGLLQRLPVSCVAGNSTAIKLTSFAFIYLDKSFPI